MFNSWNHYHLSPFFRGQQSPPGFLLQPPRFGLDPLLGSSWRICGVRDTQESGKQKRERRWKEQKSPVPKTPPKRNIALEHNCLCKKKVVFHHLFLIVDLCCIFVAPENSSDLVGVFLAAQNSCPDFSIKSIGTLSRTTKGMISCFSISEFPKLPKIPKDMGVVIAMA